MSEETIVISGLTHKIGSHGLVFYWNGEEWRRSNKDAKDIQRMMNSRDSKDIKLDRVAK